MKALRSVVLTMMVLALASCGVVRKNSTYSADSSRLNISMSDLEYLGESEISIEYRTYLGFIDHVDSINGVEYDGKSKVYTSVEGKGLANSLNSRLSMAAYKVLEEFPEAEYFIVVKQSKEVKGMFLGSSTSATATIKAYSLK